MNYFIYIYILIILRNARMTYMTMQMPLICSVSAQLVSPTGRVIFFIIFIGQSHRHCHICHANECRVARWILQSGTVSWWIVESRERCTSASTVMYVMSFLVLFDLFDFICVHMFCLLIFSDVLYCLFDLFGNFGMQNHGTHWTVFEALAGLYMLSQVDAQRVQFILTPTCNKQHVLYDFVFLIPPPPK